MQTFVVIARIFLDDHSRDLRENATDIIGSNRKLNERILYHAVQIYLAELPLGRNLDLMFGQVVDK